MIHERYPRAQDKWSREDTLHLLNVLEDAEDGVGKVIRILK